MKKIVGMALIILLLVNSTLVFAEEGYKEETIYGILEGDGTVKEIVVVNGLHGLYKDYGNYESIENLTNLQDIAYQNQSISLDESQEDFYYSGVLKEVSLPWVFDFTYQLDGQTLDLSDLAGKSGYLEIVLNIEDSGLYDDFFNQYALQVALSLPADRVSNLQAPGATLVDAAGKKQLAFVVLPGQEKTLKISADVINFEMDAMTLNGVKMVFDMDVDTSELTEELSQLSDAINQLDEGALELSTGLTQLSEGLNTYSSGLRAYADGVNAFSDGGKSLVYGMTEISQGLNTMATDGIALKAGLQALEDGVILNANNTLKSMGIMDLVITKENYQEVLSTEAFLPLLEEIEQTLQLTQGIQAYMAGVDGLAQGSSELLAGLKEYTGQSQVLAQTANELFLGASEINLGLKALAEGMVDYQSGTATLKSETSSMDETIAEKMDDMLESFMGSDLPLSSFVSKDNTSVASVQFLLKTAAVEIPVEDTYVQPKDEKEGLWERVKKLIKSIF